MDNQSTNQITPQQPIQPTFVNYPKKSSKLPILVIVLVLFIAAVGYGSYYYGHKNVSKLQADNNTLTAKISSAGNTSTSSTTPSVVNSRSFYDCTNAGGTLSKNLPLTCTVFGSVYPFPKSFDIFQVDNLANVPKTAIPLVTSIAQKNFTNCSGNLTEIYPYSYITLAQSNFIDVGIGCDSGHHEYLGLNNGQWQDLGGGQAGLDCSMVKTYGIKQSSLVSVNGSAGDTSCNNSDGSQGTVPLN